jgi:hypothetical protein
MSCIPEVHIGRYHVQCCKTFDTCSSWRITSMAALSCTCIVLHPIYPNIPNIYSLVSTTTALICPPLDSYISKRTSPNRRYYVHLSTLSPSLSFCLFPTTVIPVCVLYPFVKPWPVTRHSSYYNPWPLNLILVTHRRGKC